ncbi:phage major capsid protein [Vagococcus hydrophili]|uniref:Phage major capsid protein n=1 Tax=Vagococcus hydrophili TaxID=2714947 RepID=A0A6G8AR39_9ENTE|nr:phage major capsid protein [Vagococcus hydrophili]QIL47548.1 phage major capsid protein [Vagococcus hydrophili]
MATIEQLLGTRRANEFRTASRAKAHKEKSQVGVDIKRKQIINKINKAKETTKKVERKKVKKKPISNKKSEARGLANYLTGNMTTEEMRSLGIVVNGGKALISKKMSHKIISYVQEVNPMRKLGQVYTQKGKKGIPMIVRKAEANIVKSERDENNKIPETDTEVEVVWLEPIEFDCLVKFTKKLENKSEFDIEKILIEEIGKAIVRKEVEWFIHSNDNPYSLNNKAVRYIPRTLSDSFYKYLVGAKNSLPTAMRKGATWLINRAAQTKLESLLSEDGNPILKENGNDDFDFTLLNYPVEVSDEVDSDVPSLPVMYFGNFNYFFIQDVLSNLEIQRLNEKYADENKIGVSVYQISDGKLIFGPFETAAFKLDIDGLK